MLHKHGRKPRHLSALRRPHLHHPTNIVDQIPPSLAAAGEQRPEQREPENRAPPSGPSTIDLYFAAPSRIASIKIFATSGRENSAGGSSPRDNISRTFVPDRLTCVDASPGAVLAVAIEPTTVE